MARIEFRTLEASEIDCRISKVKTNGISLLLYKDARCDMNILDDTVGPENWQRTHELINGNLFCNVGINVGYRDSESTPVWVWKQDVGTESYAEKEKGQASDSFKRACFNWGIGRELYTAPFIWIPSDKCKIEPSGRIDSKGKDILTCYDEFYVEQILYDDKRRIVALAIKNKKSRVRVFSVDNREKK